MDKKEVFNGVIAGAGTFFTYLCGFWDTALIVLISFMILDYITGILGGMVYKDLSSEVGFKGLLRKFTIMVVLIVAVLLDRLLNDGTWVFRTLVCYFYIANEGISILENAGRLGLPLPEKLLEALSQLKEGNKKASKETNKEIRN
ncbi:MAG: phage holin family protein [Clostridiaceae bacterium]